MPSRKGSGEAAIPLSVSASKAVARREQYAGRIPLAQLPRLKPMLADTAGELQVRLEASKDGQGDGWVRGHVAGQLSLTCQRGLHPYTWPCDLSFELRLVDSETEEQEVLEQQDPYLVQDDRLPLRDLVEDEVLLSLPMLPRCEDTGCVERLK